MRLLSLISHLLAATIGFAAGIYVLPILTAPPAPDRAVLDAAMQTASFRGEFRRELTGSDPLHWGEGQVALGPDHIAFDGRLAPGPDYKLYLSPVFVENEAEFERHRLNMMRVGEVRGFNGFVVPLPAGVELARYTTLIVWCETFGQFISAARYR